MVQRRLSLTCFHFIFFDYIFIYLLEIRVNYNWTDRINWTIILRSSWFPLLKNWWSMDQLLICSDFFFFLWAVRTSIIYLLLRLHKFNVTILCRFVFDGYMSKDWLLWLRAMTRRGWTKTCKSLIGHWLRMITRKLVKSIKRDSSKDQPSLFLMIYGMKNEQSVQFETMDFTTYSE